MPNQKVAATLVARVHNKTWIEATNAFNVYLQMDLGALKKEFEKHNSHNHFDGLFSDRVIWYEMDLKPNCSFRNKVFDTLFARKGLHNLTLEELSVIIKDLPTNEIQVVDEIAQRLSRDPRVIATTINQDEFSIYDGWHTSLAFYLKNRNIPCYVGQSDAFHFYY